MQLLWGPRRRQPGSANDPAAAETAETPAPAANAAVTSKSPCFGGSGASASLRYRVLAFALLGLAMNVHGASRGRRDWVLRYDGTFTRPPAAHRIPRSGLSVTLGLGTVHAYVSAASCLLLLTAAFTTRRWLCLPALLLTASDLLGDVSDAVVASAMLTLYSGLLPALLYAAFAALVIALEYYLWSGALRWYEQGMAVHVRRLDQRIRGRIATTADSSASSVMDCNGAF